MYVENVLEVFAKNLDEFLGMCKHDTCEEGFYIMIGDEYHYVDMDNSYFYLEDDGTVVFRVNDV